MVDIKPYNKNAKKHPKKQIEQVATSIKEFGMNQPIVVDKQGVIIVGHGRYEALQSLGMEVTPDMVKVVDLTEEQAKAYRLADNKLNESDWDMDLVIEELKDLSEPMLDLTGFDKDLIIEPNEADDEVPEVPEEPQSKLGDLYELGNHRVLCGDSTKLEDVERLMDGKFAEMLFTSPPYSDMREYEGGKELSPDHLARFIPVWGLFTNYQVVNLGLQFKDGEVVPYWEAYLNHAKENGIKLLAWNVWDKTQGGSIASATNMFLLTHEWIFVFGDERKRLKRTVPNNLEAYASRHGDNWKTGLKDKSIRKKDGKMTTTSSSTYTHHQLHSCIQQTPELSTNIRKMHPATFPVKLAEQYMLAMQDHSTITCDPFLGSGSTLIASEKTGRICYGMELDPRYIDVIISRYCEYTGNYNIKKNGEDITWEKQNKKGGQNT